MQRRIYTASAAFVLALSTIISSIAPVLAVMPETNSYASYWQRYVPTTSQSIGQMSPITTAGGGYLERGLALEQQGLWNQALQVYLQGLKVSPSDSTLSDAAQRIYSMNNNLDRTYQAYASQTAGSTAFQALVPNTAMDAVTSIPILPAQAPEAAFLSTFPYKVNAFTAPSSPLLIQGHSMGCCPSCNSCTSMHPKLPVYAAFNGPVEEPAQAFVAVQPQYKTITKKIPYKTSYRKIVGYKTLCKKVKNPCGQDYYTAVKVPVRQTVTATKYMTKKYRVSVPVAAAALAPTQSQPKLITSSSSNATEGSSTVFLSSIPGFGGNKISRIVAMRIRENYDPEAYQAYKLKALRDPSDLDSRLSLATMDIDRYRFEEAKLNLDDVLSKDSGNGEAHWLMGQVHYGLAQYDMANYDYERAISLMPGNPYLNAEYVLTLQKTGQWEKARQFTAATTQPTPSAPQYQQSVSAVPILTGPNAAAYAALSPGNSQLITVPAYSGQQHVFSAVVPNARNEIQLQPQVQTSIQSSSLRGSQAVIQNYLTTGGTRVGPSTLFWMNGQALPNVGHDQDVRYPYVLTRP